MKYFRYLLMAALVAMPLTACDDDEDTLIDVIVPTGTVSGTVSIEGTGVAGVSVSLVGSNAQTATTASGGGYSFTGVEAGSYGVAISGVPADATFATTSATTSITTQGQTVTVDFSGSYIRTSSIAGQVMVDGMGIAGVSVTATGTPEGSKSAVTDNAGSYNFSGLRAGNYAIALSNIPAAYAFATATQTITVGTGEAKLGSFFGTELVTFDEVTATILIKSVQFPNGMAQNPAAIAGQMIVTLQIDPGQNSLNKVALLLDDVEVASQTLSNAAPSQDGVRMLAGGIFEVDFSVNTAQLKADNSPEYLNGTKGLSASLGINNAEVALVETSIDLTFANVDTFITTLVPSKTPVISTGGVLYWGGAVSGTAIPVNYSGKTTASVTASFTNGVGAAVTRTDATAPYEFLWNDDSATPGPLNLFQTPAAVTETFSIIRSQYSDNTLYAGGVVNMGTGITIDNVGPTARGYTFTTQATLTTVDCCAKNWAGPAYDFSDGLALGTADNANGVGGVTTTYHIGTPTGSTVLAKNTSVAALPAVTTGADSGLTPSTLNSDYWTVMVQTDALGNQTINGLGASALNVVNIAGYDNTAPPAPTLTGSVADKTVYKAAAVGTAMIVGINADDRSGFSPDPLKGTMYYKAPTGSAFLVANSSTLGGAVNFVPGAFAGVCAGTPVGGLNTGAQFCMPDAAGGSTDGYYTLDFLVQDRAGNQTASIVRRIFVDATAPSTGNVIIPTTLTGGASTTFSAAVTDNLELGTTQFAFAFAGPGTTHFIPFVAAESQADGDWDATFTRAATAQTTFPFIKTLGVSAAADAPPAALAKAAWVSVQTTDAAGNNSAAMSNNFLPTSITAGTAFAAAQTFKIGNAATTLCNQRSAAAAACSSPAVTSLAITAVATGLTGTYVNPFEGGKIYIYHVVDATAEYTGDETFSLLATVDGSSPVMTDDNTNRFYSYSTTVSGAAIAKLGALGVQRFIAIGVTAAGDAWYTLNNATITLADFR